MSYRHEFKFVKGFKIKFWFSSYQQSKVLPPNKNTSLLFMHTFSKTFHYLDLPHQSWHWGWRSMHCHIPARVELSHSTSHSLHRAHSHAHPSEVKTIVSYFKSWWIWKTDRWAEKAYTPQRKLIKFLWLSSSLMVFLSLHRIISFIYLFLTWFLHR